MSPDASQNNPLEKKAENYYLKGVSAYDRFDYDEAVLQMRTAISLDPSNAKYHYNIAFLYSLKDLPEIAVNHYKLYLKYAPAGDEDIPLVQGRIKFIEDKIKKHRQK